MVTEHDNRSRRETRGRRKAMIRRILLAASAISLGAISLGAAPALAATSIGVYGDWNAFAADDPGGKICFIATQPTDSKYSQPASGRDPAFFQVTRIPAKSIVNEASSIAGYAFLASAGVSVDVDGTKFAMTLDASQPDTTWAAAEQEPALIEAMKKGHALTLVGTSRRKTVITDTYSLSGITAALDAITKACP
jgi:invasion protein IalB